MSKQTHSQGEWQVRETATHYQIHTAEHEVALVRKVTDGAPGWSSEKDALLIKASPKLLKALRELCRRFPTDTEMHSAGWSPAEVGAACDSYDAARAVIAEAIGEEA